MRSIYDDFEAVAALERLHFGHVTGEPGKVKGHDRLAARRQTALGMIEIDTVGFLFDVDQHDFRAQIADHGR